jgi:hypothetical protein
MVEFNAIPRPFKVSTRVTSTVEERGVGFLQAGSNTDKDSRKLQERGPEEQELNHLCYGYSAC